MKYQNFHFKYTHENTGKSTVYIKNVKQSEMDTHDL